MTLNGVRALILFYFTEFDSFAGKIWRILTHPEFDSFAGLLRHSG